MESKASNRSLMQWALGLGIFTILYNLVEGMVSVYLGQSDETLALMGFGVDSFVEVISGAGIVHMIWRMRRHPVNRRDQFERRALQITGFAFYLLVAGLIAGALLAVWYGRNPESTRYGIIISLISILTMYFLYRKKLQVGKDLDSEPVISDAKCTKTCFYLSFILLASSGLYWLFAIPYVDAAGSLGIAYYAWKEGREAFQKARARDISCEC